MPKLNENYQNVKDSYLFAEIARRVKVYEETRLLSETAKNKRDTIY